VIDMGASSYVPQPGRFLQPDPVPGGSANAYSYTYGNPVNEFDPSGELTGDLTGNEIADAELMAGNVALEIAAEEAARREAEALARMQAELAGVATESSEEEWEEESGYEYVSDSQGLENGKQEAHLETDVLYQPLPEVAAGHSDVEAVKSSAVPLCEAASSSSDRSCAHDAMIDRGGSGARAAAIFGLGIGRSRSGMVNAC
jgi:hypothetical protein